MAITKKTNWFLYAVLAAAGITGYLIWKKNDGGKDPEPEPEPEPKSEPKPQPKVDGKPSKAKATQLQNLIERRYQQLNRSNELGKDFADGNFGDKSNAALKFLRPQTFVNWGNATTANVDQWIKALESDVAIAAKEIAEMKAKQTAKSTLITLANKMEKHLKSRQTASIRLLNDVNATRHEYDAARGVYLPLSEKILYPKNSVYRAKDIVNRGNGQLGIKAGQFRYFINADQFITQ